MSSLPTKSRGTTIYIIQYNTLLPIFTYKGVAQKMISFDFCYRFGSIFKSHILGCPCVMISSPEAAKFVLNKAQLFKPTFPASKERMLGKQAIFFHQGEYHANLRRLVLRTFMPEAIRNMIPNIESIAQDCLQSWDGQLITTFLEMKTVSTRNIAKKKKKNRADFFNLLQFAPPNSLSLSSFFH